MDIVTSDSTENLFWPSGVDVPESEKNGPWDPPGEEILPLYERFEANGYLELEWQCVGRKAPSPVHTAMTAASEFEEEAAKEEDEAAADEMDFDFGDSSQPGRPFRIRAPGEAELKGGARKKTASMESVMSSMRKHGLTGPSTSTSSSGATSVAVSSAAAVSSTASAASTSTVVTAVSSAVSSTTSSGFDGPYAVKSLPPPPVSEPS